MGARKLESSSAFEAETISNLANNKIELAEAKKIRDLREQITALIDDACGNRESGKRKEFESRLQQELKASSIDGLNMLSTKVEVYRDNVNKTLEKYFGMVEQREYDHLFVNRPGRDARALYKQEFLEASDAKREKLLGEFASYMAEQQKTFEELASYVSPETISRMRRSERIRLLMYVKGCGRLLDENRELFAESEIAEIKAEMADCTSPTDQQKLMTQIASNLEKRKWYKKVFDRLPSKYQQVWGKIDQMTFAERQVNYEKLIVCLEEEYEQILDNHPDRKHIGSRDRASALAYVRSDKISGGDKFRALKGLEKQIQQQKIEVSKPFETTLNELQQYKSPREIKRLRDQFYNGETYEQRKELAENIKTELINAQSESKERQDLMGEYKTKLEQDLATKIISKKTLTAALKRAENQSIDELQNTLVIYKPDRERRLKLLKQFKALPKEIQDKNTDFFELTHTERVMRMEELSQYEKSEKTDDQKEKKVVEDKKNTVEEVPNQESEQQNNQPLESKEDSDNTKIEKLMALASSATRQQNYEKAIQHYQDILAIDPQDELAAMSLQFVEGKLNKTQEKSPQTNEEAEDQQLTESEKSRLKQAINDASNNSGVMRRRRQHAMTEELTDNLKKSQAKHGVVSLENRNKNMTEDEVQANKQLVQATGKNKMLVDGKAEDAIWFNDEGYRDLSDPSKELKVENQIAKQISNGQVMDNIVAHKTDGTMSNATNAEKNLQKRKKETKNIITSIAKKKLKIDDSKKEALNAALEEEMKKKDISVSLRAA
ncbi:MAG: hypothetical protein R3B71_04260 [Candidatus Gracilibacteria bacterium]